ncbi:hydrogenase maturation protease [Lutibacter sp.]|uniref:hydrogenase maturation protease n=1 Tax=Lutibacter sp. TaxID=1925666 RepID=UPI0025C48D2E|nr:hydrogenase maturation protease [Lutibacter sp.]MCF6181086.1 hydrogenase maturation protease [Lutibacter sp.]
METLLTKKLDKTLIIGIGNNTRQDDGLGWCFLDALEKEGYNTDNLLYKYQLMVEDAETISYYDTVIFVDASKDNLKNGFSIEPLKASSKFEFTTHSVPPNQILNLCETVYHKTPKAFVIKIEGFKWNYKILLSKQAKLNLKKALLSFKKLSK